MLGRNQYQHQSLIHVHGVEEELVATPSCVLNATKGLIKKCAETQNSVLQVKTFKCKSSQAYVQKSLEANVNLD